MISLRAYAGRRVCVLALTPVGLAAAQALAAGGAQVTVWDEDQARHAGAAQLGLAVEDPTMRDWSDLALLVSGDALPAEDEPASRLIEMARSLEINVRSAETLLAEAMGETQGAGFTAGLGRAAPAALTLTAYLIRQTGRAVIGPDWAAAPRTPGPSSVVLGALSGPDVLAAVETEYRPSGLCVLDGAGSSAELRPVLEGARGPVVLSADDPATRRLSIGRTSGACLVSGRSALPRGVFVAGGRLFDATEGSARRVADLGEGPGLRLSQPIAVAAGYALARKLGVGFDDAREIICRYPGLAGSGAPIGSLGPIDVSDFSSAVSARAVADALTRTDPVVWLAGPAVDPGLGALLSASGAIPSAAILTGDRRRAQRKLAAHCPVQVERDLTSALGRALHAALRAGPGVRIVYAPGGPACDDIPAQITQSLNSLVQRANEGDAA